MLLCLCICYRSLYVYALKYLKKIFLLFPFCYLFGITINDDDVVVVDVDICQIVTQVCLA